MKFNYLLEIYDTLISEILNSRKKPALQLIDFMNCQEFKSYNIHSVSFKIATTKIKYKIESSLHSFHPLALAYKKSEDNAPHSLESFLPQIEQELNIQNLKKKYYWNKLNKTVWLYILVPTRVEEIDKEQRYFLYCNVVLKSESEKIQRSIKETISGLHTFEQIENYIHKKQLALETLAAKLIQIINPKEAYQLYQYTTLYSDADCLKTIYTYVEKTRLFIEKEYFLYLNKNDTAPIKTILNTKKELELKYSKLKLESNKNTRANLIQIVLKHFSKIMEINLKQKITYNELLFVTELIPILYNQLENKQKTKKTVKEILLEFNFNPLEFFDYYTDEIIKELDKEDMILIKSKFYTNTLKTSIKNNSTQLINGILNYPLLKNKLQLG